MNEFYAKSVKVTHMIMGITISIIPIILGNFYIPRKWDHVQTSIKGKSTYRIHKRHLWWFLSYCKLRKMLICSLYFLSNDLNFSWHTLLNDFLNIITKREFVSSRSHTLEVLVSITLQKLKHQTLSNIILFESHEIFTRNIIIGLFLMMRGSTYRM